MTRVHVWSLGQATPVLDGCSRATTLSVGSAYVILPETLEAASLDRLGRVAYVRASGFSLMALVAVFLAGVLTYELMTSLRLGFFGDSGSKLFRRLSAQSWLVGDAALYISELDGRTGSTKVRTVFFDAVGSVYAEF